MRTSRSMTNRAGILRNYQGEFFQLLKLINDILDFSDFENDNITFNIRTHDAVKLCNEVVETVMVSRKLEVEMRFDTVCPS